MPHLTQEESKYMYIVECITLTRYMYVHMHYFSDEVLMKVPPEELKAVMGTLTSDTITSYQVSCLYTCTYSGINFGGGPIW